MSLSESQTSEAGFRVIICKVLIVLQIIRLLLATVIAFVVFHAPAQMDNIMQAFGVLPRFNPQPIKIVRMLTSLLASANASANPFVYCFVSAKFR